MIKKYCNNKYSSTVCEHNIRVLSVDVMTNFFRLIQKKSLLFQEKKKKIKISAIFMWEKSTEVSKVWNRMIHLVQVINK